MPTNNFKVGEMLNKRTPNTKTWMNFDGSYTTEIHSGVVHFDDGLNNLHNINTSLFDEADADTYEGPTSRHGKNMLKHEKEKVKDKKKQGKMNRDDFDYQVPTLPFSIQIPKNIKKGYSIGQNDEFVRFIPQNVSPSKGYVNKAKNNEIQYQDAWNDTDIILEVTDRGVKETMLLKTDRAPFAFSFEVDGVIEDDLTMGYMKLEPAWLIDAVGEKRDVSQTIRREGEQTYIDLAAEVEGLVYPIEIDPTVTINMSSTSGKNGYVYSGAPTSVSGTGRTQGGLSVDSSWNKSNVLFSFDLSSIPVGATGITADLKLKGYGYADNNRVWFNEIWAYILSSNWSESTLTWNNKPAGGAGGGKLVLIGNVANNNWTDYTFQGLQSYISSFAGQADNPGFMLQINPTVQTTYVQQLSLSFKDGTYKPSLVVTYNDPPTAPTVTMPNGGETWNSSHTVEWLEGTDFEDEIVSVSQTINNGTAFVGQSYAFGQTFKTVNSNYISAISLYIGMNSNAPAPINTTFEITGVGADGLPNSTVYATGDLILSSIFINERKFPLHAPFSVPIGTMLAIKIQSNIPNADDSYAFGVKGDSGAGYQDGNRFYIPTLRTDQDMWFKIHTKQKNPTQHQIQLSTDNGVNWSDIVALTSAGVTQYIYDFINAPQTSTAMIRIRAFDGSAYGPWDYSEGVFSIIHNVAPSAPTNLTPVTTKDRAEIIRFVWQHNDPNADAQSKFDLEYRLQGAPTWNTVTQNTVNQFYDLPANTLPRGTIEWRVRTYDQADLSGPYSELKTFFAGDKPSKPTTVSPVDGSIVSVSNPTIQWSSVGQVGYNLKVLDATETEVLWETNQTSNNKAHTVGYSLENETDYVIQLTIRNADGISSNVEKSDIHVSYTPPAVPIVTSSKEESALVIEITNPIPIGTEPNVSYNSIFRREKGDVKFTRIATDLPEDGIFTDYTVASGKDYEYQVRAFGDNGTFRDSLINTYVVSFENVRLNLASLPNLQVELKFNGERSFDTSFQSTQSQFAGRKRPVTEFGIMVNNNMDLNYVIDPVEIKKLREILYKRETLLYRDSRGRKFYVTAGNFSVSDDMEFDYYEVALPLSEVDYTEEV